MLAAVGGRVSLVAIFSEGGLSNACEDPAEWCVDGVLLTLSLSSLPWERFSQALTLVPVEECIDAASLFFNSKLTSSFVDSTNL